MRTFLAELFDCREDDLRILQELDGSVLDFASIAEEVRLFHFCNLNNIIYAVFEQVIEKLQEAFEGRQDAIMENLQDVIDEETKTLFDDGATYEEIVAYRNDYPNNPLAEAWYDLDLLTSNQIHPGGQTEHHFHCNGLDSHIGLSFLDFYRRNMADVLEELEKAMGFSFIDY